MQCASLAAQLASVDEAAAIRKAFDGFESVIEARDFRQLVRLDQEFHQRIARASHNRYLLNAVTTLHNSTLRYWYFALQRRSRDQVRAAIERHLRTAAAIESRDASAAEREMRVLVGGFLDVVKGMIGQSTPPEAIAVVP